MKYYNLFVDNHNDTFTLIKIPEDDLLRVKDAFDFGRDSVFINGKKYDTKGIKQIKVFSFDRPWEEWSDYVNSEDVRNHYIFSEVTGEIAIAWPSLSLVGTDLTKDYFNNDYGWKSSKEIKFQIKHFISIERIGQLKDISDKEFDFKKLIRLCEELNSAYSLDNFYTIGILSRSIIDHVSPIFGFKTFNELSNNYSGTKSFMDSMINLNLLLRKISDSYLHTSIRQSEILPTFNQVDFRSPLDLLLAEIIRVSEMKRKNNF